MYKKNFVEDKSLTKSSLAVAVVLSDVDGGDEPFSRVIVFTTRTITMNCEWNENRWIIKNVYFNTTSLVLANKN